MLWLLGCSNLITVQILISVYMRFSSIKNSGDATFSAKSPPESHVVALPSASGKGFSSKPPVTVYVTLTANLDV